MTKKDQTISELLANLDATVEWFQSRTDIDLEEGLRKVKEGAELIKILKTKLAKVENDFQEVKKHLDVDNE